MPFDDALKLVLEVVAAGPIESVPIDQALQRVLAKSFIAQISLPPFTTSSVDGYAVRLPYPSELKILGEMAAGSSDEVLIGNTSSTVQVFTGSMLPADVEAVVMVEDTIRLGNQITVKKMVEAGANLRIKGEEISQGASLLSASVQITPPVLALLASSGNQTCFVAKQPRIAIIETGNELRSLGTSLDAGEIYAANGLALAAAARALGSVVTSYRCKDDREDLQRTFSTAIESSDFVITSGGVSVGKHDLVKSVWTDLGAKEVFWKVAIRPGRPLFFAKFEAGPLVFGLPGNPVSSLVTFFLTVRPALLKFQGMPNDNWQDAKTSTEFPSSEEVEIFERVLLKDGMIYPITEQGSHMSYGLATANALARIGRSGQKVPKGAILKTLPLIWN